MKYTVKSSIPTFSHTVIFALSDADVIDSEYGKPFRPDRLDVRLSTGVGMPTNVMVTASGPRVLKSGLRGLVTQRYWSYKMPSTQPRELDDWLRLPLAQAHEIYNRAITTPQPEIA